MFFAIEAAFCSADRVTMAGSMIPALIMSSILARGDVEADALLGVADFVHHDRPFKAGVVGQLAKGFFQGARHDADAGEFVTFGLDSVDGRYQQDLGDAAARDDAFLEGRASGAQGILDTVLLLFDLGLGRSADLDDGHATGQFGQPLLQLLTVEVGVGVLDLGFDLVDPGFDLRQFASHRRRWWCCPCRPPLCGHGPTAHGGCSRA